MLAVSFLSLPVAAGKPSAPPSIAILYPKHNAVVGKRVNVVLDPATDWSVAPFFQVLVGRTEYPVVDASSGRHALQGLALERGLNTITVRTLAPATSPDAAASKSAAPGRDGEKRKLAVVQSRSISVFNQEGGLSAVPPRFRPAYFHTRESESECSACHRLEAGPKDRKHEKPEEVLCFACHRLVPTGVHIHGPAAVWNCLSCHDPEHMPVRYQFGSADLWRVTRTVLPAEPAVFLLSVNALFVPQTATLRAEEEAAASAGKTDRAGESRSAARERQRELFQEVLEYSKQNPLDKVRIEVHGEGVPASGGAPDRAGGMKGAQQLTDARAQAVARVLREYGIAEQGRMTAVGMGNSLPKAAGEGGDARSLNERIEIIFSPQAITARTSLALPALPDRERVVLDLNYMRGPAVKNLRVAERLPQGVQYVKGSSVAGGRAKEPQVRDGELLWQFGDRGESVQETLSYLVKKERDGSAAGAVLRILFTAEQKEQTRVYDRARPERQNAGVQEVCARCHEGMLAGPFRHGPADAGYCTLCHDPHASNYPAWTRESDWKLCTACHAEKRTEVHLISGFTYGVSHPTKKAPDPTRPGKRISCISCHDAHSSHLRELLGFEVRTKSEICGYCHRGK